MNNVIDELEIDGNTYYCWYNPKGEKMNSETLTTEQVAKMLNMKVRTVQDWATKKIIPATRKNRFWQYNKSEIESWVKKRELPKNLRYKLNTVLIQD